MIISEEFSLVSLALSGACLDLSEGLHLPILPIFEDELQSNFLLMLLSTTTFLS